MKYEPAISYLKIGIQSNILDVWWKYLKGTFSTPQEGSLAGYVQHHFL